MSHMSSSQLLQQCLACLVRLTYIVFVMGVSCRTTASLWGAASRICSVLLAALLGSCRQAFFSIRFVSVHVVHPYSSIDTTAAWKKLRFILSVRSDFHMTDNLSLAVYAFARRVFMSVSVDETPLPMYVNLPTSFRELPFCVEMSLLWLKHMEKSAKCLLLVNSVVGISKIHHETASFGYLVIIKLTI